MTRREFTTLVGGSVATPKPSRELSLTTVATFIALLAAAPVYAFENLPDKNLTGGSVRTADRDAACGHARESRGRMSAVRRDEILRRYGLPAGTHPGYQIDHLIPLCLGGSDDPSNLWPQPQRSIEDKWNAEAKDRLERLMCRMVWLRVKAAAKPVGKSGRRLLPSPSQELLEELLGAFMRWRCHGPHYVGINSQAKIRSACIR
jgi:hypothetical protein